MLVPRCFRTMAGRAIARRGLVEHYHSPRLFPPVGVTEGATNVSMGSVQLISGLGVMIEGGGSPLQHPVALLAICRLTA
jgi:hypothetical protein